MTWEFMYILLLLKLYCLGVLPLLQLVRAVAVAVAVARRLEGKGHKDRYG